MIGQVLILSGHGVATLEDVDRWKVLIDDERSPQWEAILLEQYRGWYRGPQDGVPGAAILEDLAKMHESRVRYEQEPHPVSPLEIQ